MILDQFSPARWQAAYRSAARRAFREVPYYREQWAVAGRPLAEPEPSKAETLVTEQYRLCPLGRQWRPESEPTLWTGRPVALREALRWAGESDPGGVPVLEIRHSLVDWPTLGGLHARRYGVLLAADADTVDPVRRAALNLSAVARAARAGGALLVGTPSELERAHHEVEASLRGTDVSLRSVVRLGPAEASTDERAPALLHDPILGYLGARPATCGQVHLNWRRVHAHLIDGVLAFTVLRQRRPTLVNVVPTEPGFARVAPCPIHATPVLRA